ncbi:MULTISPECIES: alanine racemase [Pseudobutyrivibrio]|jgi:alanine racemase|uniref:Alanine racemase n=2 Tax=Pseudobutyrivibrio TaxID=46205 RepID=A0A2G3EDU4_9FIRM|nr:MULTISPECIES: alanine racemase [Pseudobutyrivibrio]NEX01376.1 alanine racemase [Pseudobutyrivibrio xylanivorans]PHU35265.1 alanine racemase [Pseudobutyrivibrio ruminis]PHU41325.1 alanine racemase [Pseudobutyrivibrio ruminis]SCX75062.1 alanine racemase [Pseudobutyrivibrio sp. AR14]SFR66885.1 alanine racemase [Pseudobutyrivibrio sp. NOR37]
MESTLRRTWAEIKLDSIAYNYKKIREKIGPDVKFLGVVKADAYGHGSIQVSKLLQDLGADYLAVSSADEALELRVNGIDMPILILGHTPKEQVGRLIEYHITQAITCKAKADEYSEEAVRCGGKLKVHIKVDTGMSRLGYLCDDGYFDTGVEGIVEACNMPGLDAEGIFTHFAEADEFGDENDAYTKHQFELFTSVISSVEEKLGRKFAIRHCANTGAVARFENTYLDMVRPGLLLYGYGEFARQMGLKPAMTMKTTVSTIKIYPEGTAISYGGVYVTDKTTRIGVLPYGYADGFLRSLSNKCSLYTKEGPAKLRGKICMDMCMIDITDMPSVDVGSEVEIFGEKNSIDELASIAGTIPYELTCAVSKRVPRVYYRDGQIIEKELMLRM